MTYKIVEHDRNHNAGPSWMRFYIMSKQVQNLKTVKIGAFINMNLMNNPFVKRCFVHENYITSITI